MRQKNTSTDKCYIQINHFECDPHGFWRRKGSRIITVEDGTLDEVVEIVRVAIEKSEIKGDK